jgi:putative ubiquitin-RnfH superfamily antitoxin RatB of RatAB toxin-antitoxin module
MVGVQDATGSDERPIVVEVAYALPHRQWLIELSVPPGTTCREVLLRSGLSRECPGLDVDRLAIGVFGEVCESTRIVEEGDRVEVYRPLLIDPREQRRNRVARQKK